MKKPSEIFDTPEATGFSRVVGNEEIINELTEDWYKFPPELRHSNDSILRIVLAKALTTKDQEKEEAIRESYEAGRKSFLKDIHKIDRSIRGRKISYIIFDEVGTVDWDKLAEVLPTEDNN